MNYQELHDIISSNTSDTDAQAIWSLLQRGLNQLGIYQHATYLGMPGVKTEKAFTHYIQNLNDEPRWLQIAKTQEGIKEFSGRGDNPEIVKYHQTVDNLSKYQGMQDETAWCSSFVNWCIEESGEVGTKSASAKSWNTWGKRILTPSIGCIAVFWRKKPNSWQGHVGFFIKEDADYIYVLGGNQSDSVKISAYPKHRLLSYRLPN